MRRLIVILFILSQAGCTAMLLGGGESSEGQKPCDKYPDQAHCK